MAIEFNHQASDMVFCKNPVKFVIQTSGATSYEFRIIAQLTLTQGLDEIGVVFSNFDRRYEYDTFSLHSFDFARLLDDYLERQPAALPFPSGTNTFKNMSDSMRCGLDVIFQSAYKALPDSPVTPDPDSVLSYNLTAYRGGISYFNWPENKYLKQWLAGMELVQFLTWQPNNIKVNRYQPQVLSIINKDADFTARVVVTLNNSATSIKTFTFGTQDIISIRADLPHYFSGAALENASYYDIQIFNDSTGDAWSEKRRYYIDRNPYKQENYILFRNSVAGFDIIRCFGESDFSADYNSISLDVYNDKLKPDYGFRRAIKNEEQAGGRLSTGYISRKEQQWLRDLRLSREVYLLVGEDWMPIEITNKKYLFPQQADLNIARIEYLNRFTDEVFTPSKQIVPDDIIID